METTELPTNHFPILEILLAVAFSPKKGNQGLLVSDVSTSARSKTMGYEFEKRKYQYVQFYIKGITILSIRIMVAVQTVGDESLYSAKEQSCGCSL